MAYRKCHAAFAPPGNCDSYCRYSYSQLCLQSVLGFYAWAPGSGFGAASDEVRFEAVMKGVPHGAVQPAYVTQPGRSWYMSPWAPGPRSLFGLALLFVVEGLMFYTQLADRILPYFPRFFDQTSFSVQTYQLIHRFQTLGWPAFLHQMANPPATGMTFAVQGALLSLIGGANRGAFLSLNLIYFIALQICLFVTVRWRTNNVALAWVAMAILLSANTHFFFAGDLYDYRIDTFDRYFIPKERGINEDSRHSS